MTDNKGRNIEGAILFTVRGKTEAYGGFQYSDIELIPDKRTYTNGSTVKLLINTKRANSTVLLSLRGGMEYQFIHIKGQSTVVDIPVSLKDMPNFFIEAATVSNARVHTAVREIIVPPEKRILNVEVLPSGERFKPRAKGSRQSARHRSARRTGAGFTRPDHLRQVPRVYLRRQQRGRHQGPLLEMAAPLPGWIHSLAQSS